MGLLQDVLFGMCSFAITIVVGALCIRLCMRPAPVLIEMEACDMEKATEGDYK
jgi:hypothetical protein